MTPDEFAERMRAAIEDANKAYGRRDCETSHASTDQIAFDLLRELGYGEGIDIALSETRWYA